MIFAAVVVIILVLSLLGMAVDHWAMGRTFFNVNPTQEEWDKEQDDMAEQMAAIIKADYEAEERRHDARVNRDAIIQSKVFKEALRELIAEHEAELHGKKHEEVKPVSVSETDQSSSEPSK